MVKKKEEHKASEVKVYYDPNIVKKYKGQIDKRNEEQKRLDKEYENQLGRQSNGGSRLAGMGLDASMGKDQRKFQLQSLINKKEVITLQSAMHTMGLAKGTVITYLRELNYQMWDAEENKFAGAKEGKRVGLDD